MLEELENHYETNCIKGFNGVYLTILLWETGMTILFILLIFMPYMSQQIGTFIKPMESQGFNDSPKGFRPSSTKTNKNGESIFQSSSFDMLMED